MTTTEFREKLTELMRTSGVCEPCIENLPLFAELDEEVIPLTLIYSVSPHCLKAMFTALFGTIDTDLAN